MANKTNNHLHPHSHHHDHDHSHAHQQGWWGRIATIFHLHGHSHHHPELASDQAFIDNKEGIQAVWLALAALTLTALMKT